MQSARMWMCQQSLINKEHNKGKRIISPLFVHIPKHCSYYHLLLPPHLTNISLYPLTVLISHSSCKSFLISHPDSFSHLCPNIQEIVLLQVGSNLAIRICLFEPVPIFTQNIHPLHLYHLLLYYSLSNFREPLAQNPFSFYFNDSQIPNLHHISINLQIFFFLFENPQQNDLKLILSCRMVRDNLNGINLTTL